MTACGCGVRMSRATPHAKPAGNERTDENGQDRPERTHERGAIAVSPMTAKRDDRRRGREPEATQAQCEPDERPGHREKEWRTRLRASVQLNAATQLSPRRVHRRVCVAWGADWR